MPADTIPRFVITPTVGRFMQSEAFLRILMGPRGEGKLQPIQTPVLTPSGWVKIGDLTPGDTVIAGDGSPTTVLAVYPHPDQSLWRLLFADGTSAVSGDEHLWAVETMWDREGGPACDPRDRSGYGQTQVRRPRCWRGQKVVTTKMIRDKLDAGCWRNGGRWSIPLVGPVQFPVQPVPLDAYLLGVLLGDGGLTRDVLFTSADEEIVTAVRAALPSHAAVRACDQYGYAITASSRTIPNPVLGALRDLGLMGHGSSTKFIPDVYLWNSQGVRVAVLQGLLDTDGTILRHSHSVSYSSISERLIEGVEFLVRSLGGITRRRMRQTSYTHRGERRAGQPSYHLSISLPMSIEPFRLSRKAKHVRPKGRRNAGRRYIVGYESAGEGPAVCISVAHPSGLYVCNDFIVTHNSWAAYLALLQLAQQTAPQYRPVRVACIRDTWTNLQRTSMETLREISRMGIAVQWMERDTEAMVGRGLVHMIYMGMETEKDINRLQGFSAGALWIEEPAPAAGISGGVSSDVLAVGVTSLRQPGVAHKVLITMNPPDEEHWTMKLSLDKDRVLFKIPKGERVSEAISERNRKELEEAGRGDLVARLVEGQVGFVVQGEPVTPEYRDAIHLAERPLPILKGVEIIRGWDFGLNPTCVWSQVTPLGYWHILGCVRGENIGLEQLIETHVRPWQKRYLVDSTLFRFRDIGDPAGAQREQSNSARSAVRTMVEMLDVSFEPGAVEWEKRRSRIKAVLGGPTIKGRGRLQIDPDPDAGALIVRAALRGGAHYKKDGLGRVIDTVESMKRASGLHSHVFDAICYVACALFPDPAESLTAPRPPKPPKRPVMTGVSEQSWMTV